MPNVMTPLRRFNLWIVGEYGIHSSVFPSAHVSSAFSAAWALFLFLPKKKRFGWGMLIYAMSVAVATVYGRYHYAVDTVAGLGVSLVAAGITIAPPALRPLRLRALL
jgi:membrane-associated phospholipid phosphatase